MELSEKCIQTLEKEGFSYVYEGSCLPGATYSEFVCQEKVTLFVTEGSIEVIRDNQVWRHLGIVIIETSTIGSNYWCRI